jgi:hypothetical protein
MRNFNLKKLMRLLTIVVVFLFAQEAKSQSSIKSKSTANSSPAKTVLAFLKWFKYNNEELNKITLIDMPGDTTIPYSVNIEGTEKYYFR